MKPSELSRFACQCLALDEHPELADFIKKKFLSGDADRDLFINLSSNHLVLPAVTLKFQQHGILELFPEDYKKHLLEILEINRKRNWEILQQIDEINKTLAKENIQPVYLKGTGNLLDNLYSDIGERMIGDIDLLVQEKDYLKAAELVMNLGYKSGFKNYENINTLKHYPRLYKEDVPADVEIHRLPVDFSFMEKFTTDMLFQDKLDVEKHVNAFAASNEHKIIHTFIHSQLDNKGFRNKTLVLRDLYDSFLLSKRVNTSQVLLQIEEKQKAQIFFEYTYYIFNSGIKKQVSINLPNKFAHQHQWFLNHPRWHRFYLRTLDAYELIIIRYLRRIITALFSKSSFRYLYVRLKDPDWYKIHFEGIKKIFRK